MDGSPFRGIVVRGERALIAQKLPIVNSMIGVSARRTTRSARPDDRPMARPIASVPATGGHNGMDRARIPRSIGCFPPVIIISEPSSRDSGRSFSEKFMFGLALHVDCADTVQACRMKIVEPFGKPGTLTASRGDHRHLRKPGDSLNDLNLKVGSRSKSVTRRRSDTPGVRGRKR